MWYELNVLLYSSWGDSVESVKWWHVLDTQACVSTRGINQWPSYEDPFLKPVLLEEEAFSFGDVASESFNVLGFGGPILEFKRAPLFSNDKD